MEAGESVSSPRDSLAKPNSGRSGALALSRVSDRLTFLYLDRCRIEQDDNGTHARVESEDGLVRTTYLPVATLATLLLGPGTSVTAPAAAALARNGCAVVFTGAGAVRHYSTWSPLSSSTSLLTAQAHAHVEPSRRIEVARAMLRSRFPDSVLPDSNRDGSPVSLEQLRGIEGARMKAFYQLEARKRRLSGWRRRFGEEAGSGPLDPVNDALNHANTALYGLCLAVVCALGMSPGLGFIHQGNPRSFVLDLADLYKTELTIPLAFKQAKSHNPGGEVMRELRSEFRLLRLLPRLVNDIHMFLDEDLADSEWDIDALSLWGTDGGLTEAGYNRHGLEEQIRDGRGPR